MEAKRMTASDVNLALKRKRLTQWDLGEAAGIPQGALSAILRGRRKIGPASMVRISAAIVELERR
jgi:plasmid maintenance system antidote protein VapI